MAADTPLWIQGLGMIVALSGWGKVLYDHITGRPRIRARVFQVMRGQFRRPANANITLASFVTYLYLVNTRRNSIHVLDYELEVEVGGEWERLDRVYGVHNIVNLGFLAPDGTEIQIEDFRNNLIYRKNVPVEYGKPLHGWIVFAGREALYQAQVTRYRVICVDAYRKRHVFETSSEQFENIFLLQDMAGIAIPDSARARSNL